MGTSLKVHGLKQLVKQFAKSVHALENGRAVFINKTPLSSEWMDIFDFQLLGSSDDITRYLQTSMEKHMKITRKPRLSLSSINGSPQKSIKDFFKTKKVVSATPVKATNKENEDINEVEFDLKAESKIAVKKPVSQSSQRQKSVK